MKTQILEILKQQYSDEDSLKEILIYAGKYIDFLEQQKAKTTKAFKAFLEKYNFETIGKFSEYSEYPTVTLFKGVDNWTFQPVIDYEGGVTNMDEEIGEIFVDPEMYPENEDLFEIGWSISGKLILTWLSLIWFEIDGNSYGIVVKTLENNSCRGFYFNDLAWDELSDYYGYNDKSKSTKINRAFSLDIFSILQRISFSTYPFYPYLNKWRFFKKENVMIEFVSYGNETGEKTSDESISDIKIIEHKTLLETLKYELKRSFELLSSGYIEVLHDKKCNTPIYEGAIETEFHSGVYWYPEELKNRLDLDIILAFENKYKITLPFHFKHYLRLFNGRKYNNINMHFFIGQGYLKVEEFYNIQEIEKSLSKDLVANLYEKIGVFFSKKFEQIIWLDIGKLEDNSILSINLLNSKVGIKNESGQVSELTVNFETFISKLKNSIYD